MGINDLKKKLKSVLKSPTHTLEWIRQANIKLLGTFPEPQSQNLWTTLKSQVRAKKPTNLYDLHWCYQEEWLVDGYQKVLWEI